EYGDSDLSLAGSSVSLVFLDSNLKRGRHADTEAVANISAFLKRRRKLESEEAQYSIDGVPYFCIVFRVRRGEVVNKNILADTRHPNHDPLRCQELSELIVRAGREVFICRTV